MQITQSHIFTNDLEANIKSLLIKFAKDTKIGGIVNKGVDRTVMQ